MNPHNTQNWFYFGFYKLYEIQSFFNYSFNYTCQLQVKAMNVQCPKLFNLKLQAWDVVLMIQILMSFGLIMFYLKDFPCTGHFLSFDVKTMQLLHNVFIISKSKELKVYKHSRSHENVTCSLSRRSGCVCSKLAEVK